MLDATSLPPFDQAQVDKRFLIELDRLLQEEAFASYEQWARTVGVSPSYVANISRGSHHGNLKLLYNTLRCFPQFDFTYVAFGLTEQARPEPATVPRRRRGPQPGTLYRARQPKAPASGPASPKTDPLKSK